MSADWIIYTVTNKVNGKRYVGQTRRSLSARWREHCAAAVIGNSSFPLHRAIRKYGAENFEIEAKLILRGTFANQEELDAMEVGLIKRAQTMDVARGYNATPGGEGVKLTEEILAKRQATLLQPQVNAKWRAALSVAMKGKPKSPEHRSHLSAALLGKMKGRPSPNKGRKFGAEVRARISAGRKGIPGPKMTPEVRAKIGAANKGRPSPFKGKPGYSPSPEVRARISASLKGNTPWNKGKVGLCAKVSAARRAYFARKAAQPVPPTVPAYVQQSLF